MSYLPMLMVFLSVTIFTIVASFEPQVQQPETPNGLIHSMSSSNDPTKPSPPSGHNHLRHKPPLSRVSTVFISKPQPPNGLNFRELKPQRPRCRPPSTPGHGAPGINYPGVPHINCGALTRPPPRM